MNWLSKFWGKHGERLFFLIIAVVMAVAFWFTPELKESGKVILIGAAMLCFNKARSGESKPTSENKPNSEAGFVNLKILLFFVVAGMLVLVGCAGFQDKTLSEKASQVLTTTKLIADGVAVVSDGLCAQGVLEQDQCDEINKAYESTLTAYALASDLLALAIESNDPQKWDDYQNSFASFLSVYTQLSGIAIKYNIPR